MKKMLCLSILLCLLLCIPLRGHAVQGGITVGGLNILKTSMKGEPLEGAVFQIARDLKEGELTDHTVEKQFLRIRDENRVMAIETFWLEREMTGERQNQAVTDMAGRVSIYGLPYGTYYLVEQEAPTGYNRMTEPLRVSVHKYSHLTQNDEIRDDNGTVIDNTLHIVTVRYNLPDTGNWGTLQLAAGGTGVLFSAAALILLNRKKRRC